MLTKSYPYGEPGKHQQIRAFYLTALLLSLLSASWLVLNMSLAHGSEAHLDLSVCLFKKVWGIPCPSCGTTRAAEAALHGNIRESIRMNLLGFPALIFIILLPVWLAYDALSSKDSLYRSYNSVMTGVPRGGWMLFACFICLNWIWNIIKALR